MLIKTSQLFREFLLRRKNLVIFSGDLLILLSNLSLFHFFFERQFYEKIFPEVALNKVILVGLLVPVFYFSITYIAGLFSFRLKKLEQFSLILVTQSLLFLALGFFSYWFKLPLARDVLLCCFLFNLLFVYLSRLVFKKFLLPTSDSFIRKINCLILGRTPFAESLTREKNCSALYNFRILELTKDKKNLFKRLRDRSCDLILLTSSSSQIEAEIIRELVSLKFSGKRILNIGSFYEEFLRKVPINYLQENWFIDQKTFTESSDQLFLRLKRVFDLFLASLLFLPALFLVTIGMLMIKLSSRGPLIFKQVRLGQNKQKFVIYKLRTMSVDPPKKSLKENNPKDWTRIGDPRVTKVGKFLRKMRLDELPQLVNIFRGEMSFIGPRPERPELAIRLKEQVPFYDLRLAIKPGLSGWAQVIKPLATPSKKDTLEKVSLDLYYIRNLSLKLEVEIILLTIRVLLTRKAL